MEPNALLPKTDGPAAGDPATAQAVRVRRRFVVRLAVGELLLLAVVAGSVVVAARRAEPGLLAVGVAAAMPMWLCHSGVRRYLPGVFVAARVLGRYPWRAVPAMLVRATLSGARPSIALATVDGEPVEVRFRGITSFSHSILRRTGRIWLCGPDERGRALVRFDGLAGPATVRVTPWVGEIPEPPGAEPTDGDAFAPPTADALWRDRRAAWRSVGTPCLFPLVLGVAVLPAAVANSSDFGLMVGAALITGPLIALAQRRHRLFGRHARLLDGATTWTPLPATIGPWKPRRPSVAYGVVRGTVRLPDGGVLRIVLPRAFGDLAATIDTTGTVWVLGDPGPGVELLAGVPGYPPLLTDPVHGGGRTVHDGRVSRTGDPMSYLWSRCAVMTCSSA